MLNMQSISFASGFTVKIDRDQPTLSAELEHEVERLWQAEQNRRGKAMFNGRIMSALTVTREGIDGCIVEYRYLIAQRARPELFNDLRVRPVAVSGLFECADGIVFGRRSGTTTQDAGLWELVPSGGIDTSKIVEAAEIDYVSQILTELREETGINSDSVSTVIPFCLVEDTDSHVLDIGIAMKSLLSSDEILTIHREAATKEYEELRIVPHTEVNEFIQSEASRLVGVSAMLIQHFHKQSLMQTVGSPKINNTMDLNGIRKHWQGWAKEYGTSLRATTKTSTAKAMELDALSRALTEIEQTHGSELTILEIGCGNGHNCLKLMENLPEASFIGIDFIEDMVEAANSLKNEKGIPDERMVFQVGNVLALSLPHAAFDVIFTDRCLINLNTDFLQQKAIASLAQLLKPNGHLLMIENSQQTYDMQNHLRELVGLPKRIPAEFNHFFNEATLLPFLPSVGLEVLDVEDFISLHDIVLYILVPMVNAGKVDYDHPLVKAATKLNIALSSLKPNGLGEYGQNRLYKCRKVIGTL